MVSRKAKAQGSASLLLLPAPKPYQGDDAFGVLGVSPDAATEDIKNAYIRLARRWHPDLNHSPEARGQFVRISKAYTYIMHHGDLLQLQLKCKMVEVKVGFAEFLQIHKRAKVLAGIEVDPPAPNPAYIRRDELGKKLEMLGWYMLFECPGCRWRDKCNRATGYDEVEEIDHEIRAKILAKTFRTPVRKRRGDPLD